MMLLRRYERFAFIGFLFGVMLLPAPAFASRLVSIVRAAGAGSEKAAAFTGYYVRYFLTEDGRYDVVDLNAALGSSDVEEALKAFSAADDLTHKAVSAYETLDLDPAVDYLTEAVQKYEKNAAYLIDVREVANTLMLLGAVHILRGEEKTGTERLAQAIVLHPAVEPDPRIFNPAMRQTFQRTVDQVTRKGKSTLSLTSNPGYAEVFVDGVFRGVTPTATQQLSEGRHYVRLNRDGYRGWGGIISVLSGRETSENGVLRPLSNYDDFDKIVNAVVADLRKTSDSEKAEPGKATVDLQRMLGVDQLFLAEVKLDGEHVRIIAAQYDLREQKRLKVAKHSFPYDARPEVFEREISALLRTQFGETTIGRSASKSSRSEDSSEVVASSYDGVGGDCLGLGLGDCSTIKTAALVGGGGVGVLFSGISFIMWGLAKSDNKAYSTAVQTSQNAADLKSSGKTKALVGDILLPIGVIAALGGVGFYLFYEPGGGRGGSDYAKFDFSFDMLPGGGLVSTGVRF